MKAIVDLPKDVLEHPHNYCCYTVADQIKGNYIPISQTEITEEELADFLNKLNNLASDYGLVVGGYQQEEEMLQLLMIKTIGEKGKG